MGARKQVDLTQRERDICDALYDLQVERWKAIPQEAREKAARAAYPEHLPEQLEKLPQALRKTLLGVVVVGGETPRHLRVPGWPELDHHPRLSIFDTPDEIHKALAECDALIRAGRHFRIHRDTEHLWKILSSSAQKSLHDLLARKLSSEDSSPNASTRG